ncbi:MAG: hypothetical protein HPZ74_08960 [Christensenellaceae bacterium]|nr:hypothetical protein [Christensenellaceae bacterium]
MGIGKKHRQIPRFMRKLAECWKIAFCRKKHSFAQQGESRLRARPKGMKTNEVCDRPLETFGAAAFGVICG